VYLATHEAGSFVSNVEADELRWCTPEEAATLASFERDAELVTLGLERAAALGL